MIRLRIGEEFETFSKEGLLWYKGGRTYRVVIEQETIVIENGKRYETWIPVEVIDES